MTVCFAALLARVNSRITKTTATVKSTLIIVGAFVIAMLVVREMGTLVINFRTNSNDSSLMSNAVDRCLYTDSYLNRRHFMIRSDDIIYETGNKPSSSRRGEGERQEHCIQTVHTRLLLRQYKSEDVVRCIDSLWVRKHREPVYIAFVGDSTARQHFSGLIRLIPDYDRTTTSTFLTKFAEKVYHDDMNVTSHLLADLKLAFFWRNLINEDMLSLFRRWASTEDRTQVPDLIFFGSTVHHMKLENNVSFQMYETLLEKELLPLMEKNVAVHPQQEVIWLKPSHTIELHAHNSVPLFHDRIKKYADILPRILKDTRIVIWDTINALAEEYIRACILTQYDRQDVHVYENCHDLIHTGMNAISLGTRLFLNHICETAL